jgi:hypothetical protein
MDVHVKSVIIESDVPLTKVATGALVLLENHQRFSTAFAANITCISFISLPCMQHAQGHVRLLAHTVHVRGCSTTCGCYCCYYCYGGPTPAAGAHKASTAAAAATAALKPP